jgi:murein L,D-transpeptidase YafK
VTPRAPRFAPLAALVLALAGPGAAAAERGPADRVLIEKEAHRLTLLRAGRVLRTYLVALGGNPRGHKQRMGDERTPEGVYAIDARYGKSKYHRALKISYPDARDRARARAAGVNPGGMIMIHGIPPDVAWLGEVHRVFDWTNGCIAVTNEEMDEIWRLVRVGTPVEIRP